MTEIFIVGGGIYGCGLAWELARQGMEVELHEAGLISGGASGGPGRRGVRANGRDLRELPLMRMAYKMWPSLAEEMGFPTGYDRIGHLLLIERERDLAQAPSQALVQEKQGIPTRLIEGDELREMEPYVGENVVAALYCPLDGVADHTATTQGMARAAENAGARINLNSKIDSFEKREGRVTSAITASGLSIPVRGSLLLMSNSQVKDILDSQFAVTLPTWKSLPQVLFTEPVDPMPLNHLIGHVHRVLAMKPNEDGRVMVSGGWRGRWNEESQTAEVDPAQVTGNLAEAQAVYPCLEGVGVSKASAGRWESISYDGIPIIDKLPGVSNAFFATGWSGHGWAIAPAVNSLLAEWVITGAQPAFLQPFGLGRFG